MLGQNRDNNMWLVIRYENEKLSKQHVLAETMLEPSKKIAIKLELKQNLVDDKLYKLKGKLLEQTV